MNVTKDRGNLIWYKPLFNKYAKKQYMKNWYYNCSWHELVCKPKYLREKKILFVKKIYEILILTNQQLFQMYNSKFI